MQIFSFRATVFAFTLLVTVINCYRRYKLPSYIKPCSRADPQLNKCVREVLSVVQTHLPDGIRQFNLPPMAPLVIPQVLLEHGSNFRAVYTNFSVYHVDKFILEDINVDLPNNIKTAKFLFREMTVKTQYEVDGQLIGLRLKGAGPLELNYTNIRADLIMKGSRYNRDGSDREYFRLEKGTVDLDFGRPSVYFSGLFEGDEKLNQHAVDLINDNIMDILRDMKPDLDRVIGKIVFSFIMRVYDRFSLDELFPK